MPGEESADAHKQSSASENVSGTVARIRSRTDPLIGPSAPLRKCAIRAGKAFRRASEGGTATQRRLRRRVPPERSALGRSTPNVRPFVRPQVPVRAGFESNGSDPSPSRPSARRRPFRHRNHESK